MLHSLICCCRSSGVVDSRPRRSCADCYRTTGDWLADLASDSSPARTNGGCTLACCALPWMSELHIRFDIFSESHSKDPYSVSCHDMEISDCCCRFVVWWWEIWHCSTCSLMDSYCSTLTWKIMRFQFPKQQNRKTKHKLSFWCGKKSFSNYTNECSRIDWWRRVRRFTTKWKSKNSRKNNLQVCERRALCV